MQQASTLVASPKVSERRAVAEGTESVNRSRVPSSSPEGMEGSPAGEKSDAESPFASDVDSADILEAAVEAFNSRIDLSNRSTRFRVSEETGDVYIQIIDNQSKEVIRSIPNEESLKIAARMRELAGNAVGVFVDTSS